MDDLDSHMDEGTDRLKIVQKKVEKLLGTKGICCLCGVDFDLGLFALPLIGVVCWWLV